MEVHLNNPPIRQAVTAHLFLDLEEGIRAEKVVVLIQDFLITTMHPHQPFDTVLDCNESTMFVQTRNNVHLAGWLGSKSLP
jgi:hypothetical protein